MLQPAATSYNMLQHIKALPNPSLEHTLCNTLQQAATLCGALQHTAARCNTPQHAATHCNALKLTPTH